MKRTPVVRLICFVLVCAICISFTACSKDPVVLFDEAISDIEIIEVVSYEDKEKLWKETKKKLQEIGIFPDDTLDTVMLTDEFVLAYLETHSKEELLQNVVKLYAFLSDEYNYESDFTDKIDDQDWHKIIYKDACQCQVLSELIRAALAVNEIEIEGFANQKGNPGYYTEFPDAEPKPSEWEVSGEFYQSDGTGGATATKTNKMTVEYYGDYAIATINGFAYDSGAYGWYNGTFVDELPHFKPFTSYDLYYKGVKIDSADNKQVLLDKNYTVVQIDGKNYLISEVNLDFLGLGDKVYHTETYLEISNVF